MAKATTTKKKSAAKPKAAVKKDAPKKDAPKQPAPLAESEVKKFQKAADDKWEKATAELRGRRRKAAADILQYRYDVGGLAISVVEDRSKALGKKTYGDRTVEQICVALSESQSTVHTCIKFARKCDAKELAYFKEHEWPWRAVSSIVTVEDAKAYKQLKDAFEKKQFKNTDELKEATKAANDQSKKDGTKKDKRGGSPTDKSTINSFNTACSAVTTKVMPNFLTVVKNFAKNSAKMETDVADEMAAGIKEGKKALEALEKMIVRAKEIIAEAGI